MVKERIYAPIASDLEQVERLIADALQAEPDASIRKINDYILKTPGKRLRPVLMLLAFYASLDGRTPTETQFCQLHQSAAAVELIHMASLIHDDIIDHADVRHHHASVQAEFGMERAVVQGVYLYAHSLGLLAHAGSIEVISRIAYAVKTLCQGELSQVSDRHVVRTIFDYLHVLHQKTGVLFSVAAECGAILAGASEDGCRLFSVFGNSLGIMFQIADDYMDFMGDEKSLGKAPGQDFELGEVTLPILLLLDKFSKTEREQVMQLGLAELRERVYASDALARTREMAMDYLKEAYMCLSHLPISPYRTSLELVLQFTEERGFSG